MNISSQSSRLGKFLYIFAFLARCPRYDSLHVRESGMMHDSGLLELSYRFKWPDFGFQGLQDSGFQGLDSGLQALDSGFQNPIIRGFRFLDSLTWGEHDRRTFVQSHSYSLIPAIIHKHILVNGQRICSDDLFFKSAFCSYFERHSLIETWLVLGLHDRRGLGLVL